MATFDSVLAGMQADGDGWTAHGPEDWLQGRTLYGGMSAALALKACELSVPDLPPLRAGQIAYVGPAAQDVRLVPGVLRRGRSVTTMACDLISDGAVALRALFVFGAERESAYAATPPPPPACARPDEVEPLWGKGRPGFTANIDQRLAGGNGLLSGADKGELLAWVRHSRPVAPGMPALVALGDALPPASYPRFTAPAPISTITWGFELFDPGHAQGAGWYLLQAKDDGVGQGYSMQSMAMWDEAGRPVLLARQSVAIFG
ncbi:acyl-CoA thioesterase [Sandaracinobacter neustonicus]|nr:thioesterase family protein [Sandaracinobacter neustonicus]